MRPIVVTVGPLASASATNIAASQTPAAAGSTATATFTNSSASIGATNTFVAGQVVFFTTAGQLPWPLIPNTNYFVSSTGLTGTTFQVSGAFGGTPIVVNTGAVGTAGLPGYFPAASGTHKVNYGGNVALGGSLVNSTGIAVLDTPRRILITTTDTTTTYTLFGTNASGFAQSETLLNTGTSIYSQLDYATITSITASQAGTAAITVGTNGIASTPWVRLDEYALPQTAIQVDVTGTVNFTVQSTLDDNASPATNTWVNTSDSLAVNVTGTIQTNFAFTPRYARVLLNSGSGSVTATFLQSGVVPY